MLVDIIKRIKEAKKPLTLDFELLDDIEKAELKLLADAIKEAKVPLTLNLCCNDLGDIGAALFADSIKNAKVPLTLDLSHNNISVEGIRLLADAIRVAQVPIVLDLSGNNIGDEGAGLLIDAVKESQVYITLYLRHTNIGSVGAGLLANAIKEAHLPIVLDLSFNDIGACGIELLADAIKQAEIPLTLDLYNTNIGMKGAKALSDAIKKARYSLALGLDIVDMGVCSIQLIAFSIKEVLAPFTLRLKCRFDLIAHDVESLPYYAVNFLADAIPQARAPLSLDLGDSGIDDAGISFLATAVSQALFPLTLYLDNNNIGDDGVGFLANAINKAKAPIVLNLAYNNIGLRGIELLANAIIEQIEFPITLDLSNNDIGDGAAYIIANAIRLSRVPIILDLRSNLIEGRNYVELIGNLGAKSIANAIKVAQVPIVLDLSGNSIGDSGAELLAETINEASIPLALGFEATSISNEGAELLNAAMDDNFIIDAGTNPDAFLTRINMGKKILEEACLYPSALVQLIQDYIGKPALAWTEVTAIRAVETASHQNKYSSINQALLKAVYFNVSLDTQCSTSSLSSVENKKQGNSEISANSAVLSVVTSEDAGMYNSDSEEVSSIASNSSSSYSISDSNVGNSAELSSQLSTAPNHLSSYIQLIKLGHKVTSNTVNNGENTINNLLTTMFSWIKDLPKLLQQQILSSFSMQQVLALLETTSDKFIITQLNNNQFEDIFSAEYQDYYAQDDFSDSATRYAQMSQHNKMLIGDELSQLYPT